MVFYIKAFVGRNRKFYFTFKVDGAEIFKSKEYNTIEELLRAISAFKVSSSFSKQFIKNGSPKTCYFKLITEDKEVIGQSPKFQCREEMEKYITAIIKVGVFAPVI